MGLPSTDAGTVGAITVGALWGVYVLADKIRRDSRDRKKQADADTTENSLHAQLSQSLSAANATITQERDRADKLTKEVGELSNKVGRQEVQLEHANKTISSLEKTVERLRGTVEELVFENRNKDRSITELVALNKQLLRAMGHDHATPEHVEPADTTN